MTNDVSKSRGPFSSEQIEHRTRKSDDSERGRMTRSLAEIAPKRSICEEAPAIAEQLEAARSWLARCEDEATRAPARIELLERQHKAIEMNAMSAGLPEGPTSSPRYIDTVTNRAQAIEKGRELHAKQVAELQAWPAKRDDARANVMLLERKLASAQAIDAALAPVRAALAEIEESARTVGDVLDSARAELAAARSAYDGTDAAFERVSAAETKVRRAELDAPIALAKAATFRSTFDAKCEEAIAAALEPTIQRIARGSAAIVSSVSARAARVLDLRRQIDAEIAAAVAEAEPSIADVQSALDDAAGLGADEAEALTRDPFLAKAPTTATVRVLFAHLLGEPAAVDRLRAAAIARVREKATVKSGEGRAPGRDRSRGAES